MKVLVLASGKGGAGKTTLAAHLAVAAQSPRRKTVLLDTDPQASLAEWWNARADESPAFVNAALAALPDTLSRLDQAGFAMAVIDTPPSVTEHILMVAKLASFVLIPVKPSPHDLRAVGRTVEIAEAAGRPFGFAVTQANHQALLTAQAVATLSAFGEVAPAIIGNRVDFAASMIDGRTVQEMTPKGRSASEIAALWNFVQDHLHDSKKTRKRAYV